MVQYQSTPDYYRDYIEHGWLKDAAAKTHKYIERWKDEAGFWRYRYASKRLESKAKKARGPMSAETVTQDIRNGKSVRSKDAHNSRKTNMSNARKKAHAAYLEKIRPIATENAKSRYKTRKTYIKVARGNAHRDYAKKKFGIIGYNKAMGITKKHNEVLKTFYPVSGNIWREDKTNINVPTKKKRK